MEFEWEIKSGKSKTNRCGHDYASFG